MSSKSIEIYPDQNLLSTTEEADQADNFWIGGDCKLFQWSVSQEELIKDYGCLMPGTIYSMVQTSNKKFLFVTDLNGYQKRLDVTKQKVIQDFGKIHGEIWSIAITNDGQHLWTGDFEANGHVKQFR